MNLTRISFSEIFESRVTLHIDLDQVREFFTPAKAAVFGLQDNYLSEYFALEASYPNAVDVWCLNLYRGLLHPR